ncbi:MAG: hypothetical protein LV479_01285 [Methylacidiphilales bacterium]|nr:hypothetical protein [Candidatus Methylacidiphilales bacterium]
MQNRPTVALLYHKMHEGRLNNTLVREMIPHWKAAGFEIRELFGIRKFVPADTLYMHVDLSVVPPDYLAFAHRYPRVINGRITDIRKRLYSQIQVRRGDGYKGQVLVKTSHNYGGGPEALLRSKSWGIDFFHRAYRAVARRSKNSPYQIRTREQYRIYPSVDEVPDEILNSPELVIEKYLPEREGGRLRLRYYFFLGDHEVSASKLSGDPLCLKGTQTFDENEIPDEIRQVRKRMGLDYGKIDYAIHEGKPVFFDVNKTQGVLPNGASDFQKEIARRLAGGLRSFFPEMQAAHAVPA